MMFKEQTFKSLCKQAWSGVGLTIGQNEGVYVLSGGYWIIKIKREALSNKAMATLIELTGHLPEEGELWMSRKDEADQYELNYGFDMYNTESMYEQSIEIEPKNILIEQATAVTRVMQDETDKIILINECFIQLIDNKHIMTEIGEEFTDQPRRHEAAVLWKNNMCELVCYKRTLEEQSNQPEIILTLEKARL